MISGWQLPASADSAELLLVRNPDRVAMWSAVFNTGSASVEVSRRALELLGRRARLIDLGYRSKNALLLMHSSAGARRLSLPSLVADGGSSVRRVAASLRRVPSGARRAGDGISSAALG